MNGVYIKQRMVAMASGKPLTPDEPRHWVSSMEALGRILSEKNILLIEIIRNSKPQSLSELAKISGRAKTNLSKTLHAMRHLGLLELEKRDGGKKAPRLRFDEVAVRYCLTRKSKHMAA